MGEERVRRCVTGADPERRFPIPIDGQFDGREFREAPELAAVAEALIGELPEFADLAAYPPPIRYVWRQKGGKTKGREVLGWCVKISGLVRYYGATDWTIALAADACRGMRATHFQIEALLFHELMHIEPVLDEDTGEVSYRVRGEDAYAFVDEIRRYGAWKSDLGQVADAWSQAPLFARGAAANGRGVDPDGDGAAALVRSVVEGAVDGARRRAGKGAAVADRVNLVTADS